MTSHATPATLSCFVTGTDTEIGKTLVSCALLLFWQQEGLRTLGLKPIAAGADEVDGELHNEDVDALAACSTEQPAMGARTPYLLRTPAAPHIAAELEGVRIEPQLILERVTQLRSQAQAVVVEGVGGFRVPWTDDAEAADLAAGLNLPVILVVGLRLGCINQALLTYEAIVSRGLQVAGWVANHGPSEMAFASANVQALQRRMRAPLLGVMARVAGETAAERAQHAVQHLDAAAVRQAFSRWSNRV